MWYTALKNLSKCFSATLLSYEAAPLDGLLEHYSYGSQEPCRVLRTVVQYNINGVFIRATKCVRSTNTLYL